MSGKRLSLKKWRLHKLKGCALLQEAPLVGRWIKCTNVNGEWGIHEAPGIYVVYSGKTLIYVGRASNLRNRVVHIFDFKHWPNLRLKIKYSKRYGDWLMWEVRLIRRLKPCENRRICR